jgi:hypothetical protein
MFVLIISLSVLFAATGAVPAEAATSAANAEIQFLDMLNGVRAGQGLPTLARDPGLDGVARSWSGQMSAETRLYHRPDLAAQIVAVEPAWRRAGENVGYGGDVGGLHQAFMNSPKHYDNIVGDWNRIGVGVVVNGNTIWITFNFLKGPALPLSTPAASPTPVSAASNTPSATEAGNLWLVTSRGRVHTLGNAPMLGDLRSVTLNRPIVGMAPTTSGKGYWMVASDGGMFAFGDAQFYGSMGGRLLAKPIVAMAATPTGAGYWLVASDGGVFAFGDAQFYGSTGNLALNQPINGLSATASGRGYWMVAADGGMFAFGDAGFYGSLGDQRLGTTVNGLATSPTGNGYWLVGADGSVHAFGSARDYGSANAGGVALTRVVPTSDGLGYRMAAADGRVFLFGSAGSGVTAPLGVDSPVVALAAA